MHWRGCALMGCGRARRVCGRGLGPTEAGCARRRCWAGSSHRRARGHGATATALGVHGLPRRWGAGDVDGALMAGWAAHLAALVALSGQVLAALQPGLHRRGRHGGRCPGPPMRVHHPCVAAHALRAVLEVAIGVHGPCPVPALIAGLGRSRRLHRIRLRGRRGHLRARECARRHEGRPGRHWAVALASALRCRRGRRVGQALVSRQSRPSRHGRWQPAALDRGHPRDRGSTAGLRSHWPGRPGRPGCRYIGRRRRRRHTGRRRVGGGDVGAARSRHLRLLGAAATLVRCRQCRARRNNLLCRAARARRSHGAPNSQHRRARVAPSISRCRRRLGIRPSGQFVAAPGPGLADHGGHRRPTWHCVDSLRSSGHNTAAAAGGDTADNTRHARGAPRADL
mmetsp:Transcript_22337/g.47633  ORF Transcript_22337/g.47633 Transcript_22337/m.47633 type:complete len:397 (+) Transcript_22337:195-1385(+)